MKNRPALATLLSLLICLAPHGMKALDISLLRFAGAKESQARELAEAQTNKVPDIVWKFFDAVKVDDWETATNLAGRLEGASGRYTFTNSEPLAEGLRTAIWPVISETIGTYECFHEWDNKLLRRFGTNIIASIPQGSIYFGGTDPGRFVITALSESHREGNPFFTLTQNQLADGTYLDYLRTMYGRRIVLPSTNDSLTAFQDYMKDAQARMTSGKLKPGEEVRKTEDGRVQVSGQVAVMQINGLLVKNILQKNPDREFYVEESFPLDWMYPQLTPHGLIMQLHREPLALLPEEKLRREQAYWVRFTKELIGDWLTEKTSVSDLCEFADKVYLQKNLDGFKGDRDFAKNEAAQKTFSKLRSAHASLFDWRAQNSKDDDERERMRLNADLAFKQAFALCPYSPEAVFRYCNFLVAQKRPEDALRLAKTANRLMPDDANFKYLLRSLDK